MRRSVIRSFAHRLPPSEAQLPIEGHLPGFDGATGWLNSEPLTPDGLRGRVVLVDFWTYTCINWLRTLPYLRAWAAKYGDHAFTIIGVHTPEFGFEHDVDNIVPRAKEFGVDYPIAIDSEYGVWHSFANHYWPAVYLADAEGRIRYHHFGEGEYAMTEMAIQLLLMEAGDDGVDREIVDVDPEGFEVEADWRSLHSPEAYLGYGQTTGLVAPSDASLDAPQAFPDPPRLRLNQWAPTGTWTIAQHATVLNEAGGRIAFRFQARDVNLVIGPPSRESPVPMHVTLDGQPPAAARGFDVDDAGDGVVADQRLYQLIRQPGEVAERTIDIEFAAPGVEAYCFTFG
jgi:thiol-disulfide isomerase/thioredoxin